MKKFTFILIFLMIFISSFIYFSPEVFAGEIKPAYTAKSFKQSVLNAFFAILIAAVSWLTTMATKFINEKTKEAQAKKDNILIKNLLSKVNKLITETISAGYLATKKQLKTIPADGKIDKQEIESAAHSIYSEVIQVLGSETTKELDSVFKDSRQWLKTKIKSQLVGFRL